VSGQSPDDDPHNREEQKTKTKKIMKVNSKNYSQAIKRVIFLEGLYNDSRISYSEACELAELQVALQQYEDESDAEALAEYEFMNKFEDSFVNSFDR
jgi:hypothetical protein